MMYALILVVHHSATVITMCQTTAACFHDIANTIKYHWITCFKKKFPFLSRTWWMENLTCLMYSQIKQPFKPCQLLSNIIVIKCYPSWVNSLEAHSKHPTRSFQRTSSNRYTPLHWPRKISELGLWLILLYPREFTNHTATFINTF